MDECAYLERQNLKRRYKKGLWCCKYRGKDERESFKMNWVCAKKGHQRTGEEDRKLKFSKLKKGGEEDRR